MIKNEIIKLCNITLLSLKNYYNLLFKDININHDSQSIFKYLKLPTSNFIIKRYIYKLIIQSNIYITFLFNKYLRLNKLTFFIKRHKKLIINHFVFKKSVYFFIKHFNLLLFYTFILYNIKLKIKKNNNFINNRFKFTFHTKLRTIQKKINIKTKIINICTFFRKKYYNNYDLIMQIKNILLLFLYRLLCFRYLGVSGLELSEPEAFNIDKEAFDLLKTEVASAPNKDEICAATKLMKFNNIEEANKNGNHYLIPTQLMEQLHPGDFYNLSNNLDIKSITEFKYILRDTTLMPTRIHILKTILYGSGNNLLYGVSKEDQKELLQELISEIQSSNKSKSLYIEIDSDKNNEYLINITKKKMLKENFKGNLTPLDIHQRWELMYKEDLSKHMNVNEITTTKQFRKAMLEKDSWDHLALEKVFKDKNILESIKKKGSISELDRYMLGMTDDRTNFKTRKIAFGGNITVTNVNEIGYNKLDTSKQVFPNHKLFNLNFKYLLNLKKLK